MYSTCLFCHAELGRNEEIEHFPVGRRLAFDAGKGRLWVVCRRCERWNLTPLEERWEAIEQCERLFRSTRLRVSTDNIGLARLKGGTELVRIGEPLRPELAAWRYGDQFGRRRRRKIVTTVAWGAAAGAIVLGGVAGGLGIGAAAQLPRLMAFLAERHRRRRIAARISAPDGALITIRGRHLTGVELLDDGAGQWVLRVPHDAGDVRLSGDDGLRAAGLLLPRLNSAGASSAQVRDALEVLETAGDPLRVFSLAARRPPRGRRVVFGEFYGAAPVGGEIQRLRPAQRLALEMAAHEEAERRAMAGELLMLEQAWRHAEEIAAIADDLLVPRDVNEWVEKQRPTPEG